MSLRRWQIAILAGSQSALGVLDDNPVECDLAIVLHGDGRHAGQGGAQHIGAADDPQGAQHAAEAFNVGQHDVSILRRHVDEGWALDSAEPERCIR